MGQKWLMEIKTYANIQFIICNDYKYMGEKYVIAIINVYFFQNSSMRKLNVTKEISIANFLKGENTS